jgi:threonine dehydrogenase-like Zn-dependent dehydrogenase
VRLKVAACGICGTDLHLLHGARAGSHGAPPGHEIAGVPLDGPAGLDDALYAVEPRTWCGECIQCQAGRRQLCVSGQLLGIHLPGGLAEFVDTPAVTLHRVPNDVDLGLGSLAEPLAVCVRAVDLAQIESGTRVLVLGAGSIGLLSGLLARDRAERVAIVARHPQQRDAARKLGLEPLAESDVQAWAESFGPDVVIETVGGAADTLATATRYCAPAGRIVVLGVFGQPRPIDAMSLVMKELTLIGSDTYGLGRTGSEFGAATRLLSRYGSELAPLQTHEFPLGEIARAFECAEDKSSGAIKVTVTPPV